MLKPHIQVLSLAFIIFTFAQAPLFAQDQKPNVSNVKKQLVLNHLKPNLTIKPQQNPSLQVTQGQQATNKEVLSAKSHQNLTIKPKLSFPLEIDPLMKNPLVSPIQKSLSRWTIEWNATSVTYECEWEILGNAQHILQNLSIQILQTGWWYLAGGKPVSPIKNDKKGTLSWDIQWQDPSKNIEKDHLIIKIVSKQPLSDAQKQTLSQMFTKLPLPESGKLEQKME
jgi:hypothetical protein